jgi:hemerythrin-like domain-containing protein
MGTQGPARKAARPLVDPPAGFDDPLEMLLACHRRIEKQLETLKRLRAHLAAKGVDPEASAAAQSILRYFAKSAVDHHQDEEHDVFPLLEARMGSDGDAVRFRALRAVLEADHRELEAAWHRLKRPLEGVAEGLMRTLPEAEVLTFCAAYASHILAEETVLPEFFRRWVDERDQETLGRAMAARRRLPYPPL